MNGFLFFLLVGHHKIKKWKDLDHIVDTKKILFLMQFNDFGFPVNMNCFMGRDGPKEEVITFSEGC